MAENTPGIPAALPGQQTVPISSFVRAAAQTSYTDLVTLCSKGSSLGDDNARKVALLQWLHKSRQMLLRLLVVAKWARQHLPLVERCQLLSGILSHHDFCFSQAADSLWLLHQELQQARAPIYDLPSAAEVLTTGTYQRLPKCIQDLQLPSLLAGEERSSTVEKLNTVLRSRLLDLTLPEQITSIEVEDGRAIVTVRGEYRAELTLGYGGTLDHWCILKVDLLVGIGGKGSSKATKGDGRRGGRRDEQNVHHAKMCLGSKNGRSVDGEYNEALGVVGQRAYQGGVEKVKLTEGQQKALAEDLQRRMAGKGDPLVSLHEVLHEICMALVTDAAVRQAKMLRQGRWRDAIKFELLGGNTDGAQGVPGAPTAPPQGSTSSEAEGTGHDGKAGASTGLKISYWLPPQGSDLAGGAAAASSRLGIGVLAAGEENLPSLKIEVNAERNLACFHSPTVIDPLTGCEAELALDPGAIDLENLLLRAIRCSIYTRLLEAEAAMKGDRQLSVSDDDVVLSRPTIGSFGSGGEEDRIQFSAQGASCGKADDHWPGQGEETLWAKRPKRLETNTEDWHRGFPWNQEVLEFKGLERSEEVEAAIWVRAYGSCYMGLSIDMRTGQFKLRAPGGRGLEVAAKELEEMLNTGAMTTIEVMVALRYKCLLHLYQSLAPELGLLAYDSGLAVLKIPIGGSTPSLGPNTLVLGFRSAPPDSAYFLALQLRPDFLPSFTLFQAKVPNKGSSHSRGLFAPYEIERFMVLEVGSNTLDETDCVGALLEDAFWQEEKGNLGTNNEQEGNVNWGDGRRGGGKAGSGMVEGGEVKDVFGGNGGYNGEFAYLGEGGRGEGLDGGRNAILTSPQTGNGSSMQQINWQTEDGIDTMDTQVDGDVNPSCGDGNQDGREEMGGEMGGERQFSDNSGGLSVKQKLAEMGFATGTPGGDSVLTPQLELAVEYLGIASGVHGTEGEGGFNESKGEEVRDKWGVWQGEGLEVLQKKRNREEEDVHTGVEAFPLLTRKGVSQFGRLQKRSRIGNSLVGLTYWALVELANQGAAPVGVYSLILSKAVGKCSLCIKHRQITEQFSMLGIPSVEDIGLNSPSFSFRFRLPGVPSPSSLQVGISSETFMWRRLLLSLEDCGTGEGLVLIPDPHYQRMTQLAAVEGTGTGTEAWSSISRSQKIRFLPPTGGDQHMLCTPEGMQLRLNLLEEGAFEQIVEDVHRLWKVRMFTVAVQEILAGDATMGAEEIGRKGEAREAAFEEGGGEPVLDAIKKGGNREEYGLKGDGPVHMKRIADSAERLQQWEIMRRTVRVEAVGPTCVWLFVTGALQGTSVRVAVEWKRGDQGCSISVAPDPIFPHTKFLEEYVNHGEVELLLDALRITCGPLFALYSALRPVRYMVGSAPFPITGLQGHSHTGAPKGEAIGNHGKGGSNSDPGAAFRGMTLPTLLPPDISVVLRSPYKVRIIFRGQIALDMRCFAGDQVWLQPVTPIRGVESSASGGLSEKGVGVVGSLWCPQFRPFVMDQVQNHLVQLEATNRAAIELAAQRMAAPGRGGTTPGSDSSSRSPLNLQRVQSSTLSQGSGSFGGFGGSPGVEMQGGLRPSPSTSLAPHLSRASSNALAFGGGGGGVPHGSLELALGQIKALQALGLGSLRVEVQSAMVGVVDDSVYGGAWVSVMVLKRLLRSTLRYLGTVWLFAQFPAALAEVFPPETRGRLGPGPGVVSQDMEQPALRFFVNDHVYMVNMHRHKRGPGNEQLQLTLTVMSAKRRQPGPQEVGETDLSPAEMAELSDFFNRRVTSEPYDAARLASFLTIVTLPIPVLHEFLALIMWKKDTHKAVNSGSLPSLGSLGGGGGTGGEDGNQMLKPRVELCLENRRGPGGLGTGPWWQAGVNQGSERIPQQRRSNIRYDRERSCVEFTLAYLLDSNFIGGSFQVNTEGGATWLPYCVAIRLNYAFGEGSRVSLLGVEGSHRGSACWPNIADWEKLKGKLAQTVELVGGGQGTGGQASGIRLRIVAEALQAAICGSLRQMARVTASFPSAVIEASLAPLP